MLNLNNIGDELKKEIHEEVLAIFFDKWQTLSAVQVYRQLMVANVNGEQVPVELYDLLHDEFKVMDSGALLDHIELVKRALDRIARASFKTGARALALDTIALLQDDREYLFREVKND